MKYPQKVVNLAFFLLKKNGILILTTPHDPKLWSIVDEYADHVQRFTMPHIKKILQNFKILTIYTLGFPCMRTVIQIYNFLMKIFQKKHHVVWRGKSKQNLLYFFLLSFLLKIDDAFNSLNKGSTIVVVAKKM